MPLLDRTQAPPTHPIEEISVPKVRIQTLDNGIPLHIIDNPNLELIHFIIHLNVGTLHEHKKHQNVFTYELLKESSKVYAPADMADLLDFYGTYYSISCDIDYTDIKFSIPQKNILSILPLIFDFFVHPCYRESSLELNKKLRIKNLEYDLQKTDFRCTRLLLHTVFGEQYTTGQYSTPELVQSISLTDMEDYHRETFCAENLQIFVTGNLRQESEECLYALFSQVPHGRRSLVIENLRIPVDTQRLLYEEMPGAIQSSIALCTPSLGYSDADRRDFEVLSTILGGHLGSRLMQNLREKHGYTYGISAGCAYFGNQSLLIINSDVNIENTQAALKECYVEIARLSLELMGEEELENTRNYLIGSQLQKIDNSVSYLSSYVRWQHYGVGPEEISLQFRTIRTITKERIQRLAQEYLPCNKFIEVVVGRL